ADVDVDADAGEALDLQRVPPTRRERVSVALGRIVEVEPPEVADVQADPKHREPRRTGVVAELVEPGLIDVPQDHPRADARLPRRIIVAPVEARAQAIDVVMPGYRPSHRGVHPAAFDAFELDQPRPAGRPVDPADERVVAQ